MTEHRQTPVELPDATASLRAVPLFASLSDNDLALLQSQCSELKLAAGDLLFSEGDHGDAAYVLAAGEVEIFKTVSGREVLLAAGGGNRLIGEMALLLDEPRNASVRARTEATLVQVAREQFSDVLTSSSTAAMAMLEVMISRWRGTESKLKQSDRMVQLGTLTAGLAHELNNPAAAVERGAEHLDEAVAAGGSARAAAAAAGIDLQDEALTALLSEAAATGGSEPALDAITRMDREAAVEEWLEERGIDSGWELAPALVAMDTHSERLDEIAAHFGPDSGVVVRLLAAEHEVAGLLKQMREGAKRISAIVKALKSYSYLDQAPQQEVSVTEGLEDTLLILRAKTRDLTIHRDYADDLVPIQAYGSELNQVWTNLIDNAAYAIEDGDVDGGRIVIRAFREGDEIVVEIEDNGPGIPDEIQDRIFDSFFTTKPVGAGTGLGLDISYGIVVDRHRGDLNVTSEPGRTCFRVELPIQPS